MERTNPCLFQSTVREFTDITNYRPSTANPDLLRQALKSSYVGKNNYDQKYVRSTSSRDQSCVEGLSRYDKSNKNTPSKLSLETLQSSDTSAKNFGTATTPRKVQPFSDQMYSTYSDFSSFATKKLQEPAFNRSLKTSRVSYKNDAPYFGGTEQKQNSPEVTAKGLRDQKSTAKDKFNFRDSLGSLSKQIKNTLKLPIKNIDVGSSPLSTYQSQQIQPLTPKKTDRHVSYRADSIRMDDKIETLKKQQKSSSFYATTSANRLKRPKNLELNFNNNIDLKKQKTEETQKNIYTQIVHKPQKYARKNIQNQFLPLGRSTVTSTIFQKDNQLKYSYVIQPLTPQLRNDKKYDSYNFEKQKQQKSKPAFIELNSSIKAQVPQSKPPSSHSRNSSIVTNLTANKDEPTKNYFMTFTSGFETARFTKDRDSLSSRERSSFSKEFTLNDFQLGSMKGEGRFGKFYPAVHKKTGFLVGIKEIKKQSLKYMLDQFIQELKIQMYINHPNIVKLYGYFCTKQNFYLILEYMEEGSLFSFIKKSKKLQEIEASTKLKQICSAVEYLHENEILHRDIKPENIVMTCDVCKLCDFGWAVYSSTRRKTYCGTLDYVCPEILQGDSYDACVDIWAIGVLAYEMIVGKAPFYNISRKETMKKIMDCNFDVPKELSTAAKDFVLKALNKNPQYRQSVQALSKHQFLN